MKLFDEKKYKHKFRKNIEKYDKTVFYLPIVIASDKVGVVFNVPKFSDYFLNNYISRSSN